MSTVMLRFHVTGNYEGRKLDFYCDAGNREAGQAAASAYYFLTGKQLRDRRRGWHCSHSRGKPITFILFNKDVTYTIHLEAIGRAETNDRETRQQPSA